MKLANCLLALLVTVLCLIGLRVFLVPGPLPKGLRLPSLIVQLSELRTGYWDEGNNTLREEGSNTPTTDRPAFLTEPLAGKDHPIPPTCDMQPSTLHWGWKEACKLTRGGDEVCELFMNSSLYHDETRFLARATRSRDSSFHPSLVRLKSRAVEALLNDRPVTMVAMGPSTTAGKGCPKINLRWTDALNNLSNFQGSPLRLKVINQAKPATPLKTQWHAALKPYENDPKVDLIVIDYTVTTADKEESRKSTILIYSYVQSWKRPPAILFLETVTIPAMARIRNGTSACTLADDFEIQDPFYSIAKELKLPVLSYPDIACEMPALNRSTRSTNGVPFLHSYVDVPHNVPVHYGCGVHLILAQALNLFLKKIVSDSCDAVREPNQVCTGKLKDACAKGFELTLQEAKQQKDVAIELSKAEECEVHIQTSLRFARFPFAAVVGNTSNWHPGADRPGKNGWIANEKPAIPVPTPKISNDWLAVLKKFPLHAQLAPSDIVFFVHLSMGTVFVEYLSSYQNIGSATCQLEDLNGQAIGPAVKIDALWSHKYSISSRATLSASNRTSPPGGEPNAAVRCREEGKKFKIISIESC